MKTKILKKSFFQKIRPIFFSIIAVLIVGAIFYGSFLLINTQKTKAVEDPLQQLYDYLENLNDWVDQDFATLGRYQLAKAPPDECFFGVGDARNTYVPTGIDTEACETAGGHPKVNQAYVWGLTKSGEDLWFGTAPNVHCLVIGGYLGITNSILNDSYVCEFGESKYSPPLPEQMGDARPLRIYRFNLYNKTIEDKTPLDPKVSQTIGIRSAGSLGDVAFLGGPGFSGVNLFAFNTQTGQYLGSYTIPGANNIRKWLVVDNVLYTAIGAGTGGKVLRWTGNLQNPFSFEEVGLLDSSGAELAEHEGRLFVSTWPGGELSGGGALAGLYMSPEIPEGGLTNEDYNNWTKVWQVSDYEPDPVTAATYGGGALKSFEGHLYWGTMHVPMLSTLAHFSEYGFPSNGEDVLAAFLGTYRAISIFRGDDFGTSEQEIELLYGMPQLPVYIPDASWHMVDNNMGGAMPLYGPSGFGNPFNNYTWTMDVYNDQLFVGTMDWSYLALGDIVDELPAEWPFQCDEIGPIDCDLLEWAYNTMMEELDPTKLFGADLFRFENSNFIALPESLAGVGNYSSYGIRTMVSDDSFYLGMANPMNLMTDPYDDKPEGGWELMCLTNRDIDQDGIADCADNCPYYHNPSQNIDICPTALPHGYLGIGQNGTIIIYDDQGNPIVEVPTMTDSSDFDFEIQNQAGLPGAINVSGLILNTGTEKSIYIPKSLATGYVCVVDSADVTLQEILQSGSCEGETIQCPGTAGGYTCTVEEEYYKVSGLSYSAGKEISYVPTGGGGGGRLITTPPTDVSIIINGGNEKTSSTKVTLTLKATGAAQMAISNTENFDTVSWEDFVTEKEWTLAGSDGQKTVYAKFRSSDQGISEVVNDSIILEAGIKPEDLIQKQEEFIPDSGYLIKGPGRTIYYVYNGKKYPFPNWNVFQSWYGDKEYVVQSVTQQELDAIPDGGVFVKYKPGVKLIKEPSDSKTFAVDLGGILRWIINENIASGIYGSNWNKLIDDLVKKFFSEYPQGENIDEIIDYNANNVISNVKSIGQEFGY